MKKLFLQPIVNFKAISFIPEPVIESILATTTLF
jgi:hypothetical protein